MRPKFHNKWSCLHFLQEQLGSDAMRFEAYGKRAEQWLTANARGRSSAGTTNHNFDKCPCDTVTHQKAWIENAKQCEKALYILNRYGPNNPKMKTEPVAQAIRAAIAAWSGEAPYEGKRWKLVNNANYSVAPYIVDHYRAANAALSQWEQLPDGEPQ